MLYNSQTMIILHVALLTNK